jgi:tetratricopeptide (TPR) repeat protein
MARRLHLSSHSSIADFESGRRVPHADIAAHYERVFGIREGDLQRVRLRELASRTFDQALLGSPCDPPQAPFGTKAMQPVHSQLPPDVPRFVARREEILQVVGTLTSLPKSVGIFGAPGIGKTALAVHLASLTQIRFPDGRLCVDLRGDTSRPVPTSAVLARLLRWLRVSPSEMPTSFEERLSLYQTLTASRSLTVVLDNAHDEAQVRDLLPLAGDCLVIVTGRRTLYGLSFALTLVLPGLGRDQALELLVTVAKRPDLRDGPGAELIVQKCDGLPLALVIVAERLAVRPGWSAESLARLLGGDDQGLDYLVSGELSVKGAFNRSYVRLDELDKRLFRRAALLGRRPFDRNVADLLVDASAAAALERLVDENLVRTEGGSRYQLDGLLYSFARERTLAEDSVSERRYILERVLGWLTTVCEQARLAMQGGQFDTTGETAGPPAQVTDHDSALDWYESQRCHLVAAVSHAARSGQVTLAARLCRDLGPFFQARKYWAEWIATHRIGVRCAQVAGDLALEATLLRMLGEAYLEVGLNEFAMQCLQSALRLQADDTGPVLASLGKLHLAQDNMADAAATLQLATRECSAVGCHRALVRASVTLGAVRLRQRDTTGAIAILDEASRIADGIGDTYGRADALLQLARAHIALNEPERAVWILTEALALRRQIGDRFGEAAVLQLLGDCHRRCLQWADAYAALDQARRLQQEFDHRFVEGNRWLGAPPVEHPGPRAGEPGTLDDMTALLTSVPEAGADHAWFTVAR